MYQVFSKTEAAARRSSKMESRDHSNAANPKSLMSRGKILQRTFLIFAVFWVSMANGYSQNKVKADNVFYELTNNSTTLKISGNGYMTNYNHSNNNLGNHTPPWYGFRDLVKTIEIEESVKGIGNDAFKGFKQLETVEFPGESQLYRIGTLAFAYCEKLKSFRIPASIEIIENLVFAGCSGLLIEFFAPVPSQGFGLQAFHNIANLTVIVPKGSESLYQEAPYLQNTEYTMNFTLFQPSLLATLPQSIDKGEWVIIVSAFFNKAEAQKVGSDLQKKYPDCNLEILGFKRLDGRTAWRVIVDNSDKKEDAEKMVVKWKLRSDREVNIDKSTYTIKRWKNAINPE